VIYRFTVASLSKNNLLGTSLKEEALVDQWYSFISTEIRPHLYGLGILLLERAPYNKAVSASAPSVSSLITSQLRPISNIAKR